MTNAVYLQDSGAEVGGLRVWGSPWQPWFHDWAFNLPRGKPLREKWEQIPEGLDVLVTHGPPMEILDRTVTGEHVGCEELRARLEAMESPPRLHVFGHIHEARGIHRTPRTTFVNASVCDVSYQLVHEAAVVEL